MYKIVILCVPTQNWSSSVYVRSEWYCFKKEIGGSNNAFCAKTPLIFWTFILWEWRATLKQKIITPHVITLDIQFCFGASTFAIPLVMMETSFLLNWLDNWWKSDELIGCVSNICLHLLKLSLYLEVLCWSSVEALWMSNTMYKKYKKKKRN